MLCASSRSSAAGDAQRCFEAASLIGDAAQKAFALVMLGKIAWRSDDYDLDELYFGDEPDEYYR